jgi:hypothetical protein
MLANKKIKTLLFCLVFLTACLAGINLLKSAAYARYCINCYDTDCCDENCSSIGSGYTCVGGAYEGCYCYNPNRGEVLPSPTPIPPGGGAIPTAPPSGPVPTQPFDCGTMCETACANPMPNYAALGWPDGASWCCPKCEGADWCQYAGWSCTGSCLVWSHETRTCTNGSLGSSGWIPNPCSGTIVTSWPDCCTGCTWGPYCMQSSAACTPIPPPIPCAVSDITVSWVDRNCGNTRYQIDWTTNSFTEPDVQFKIRNARPLRSAGANWVARSSAQGRECGGA